jgi:hypothetical protein
MTSENGKQKAYFTDTCECVHGGVGAQAVPMISFSSFSLVRLPKGSSNSVTLAATAMANVARQIRRVLVRT